MKQEIKNIIENIIELQHKQEEFNKQTAKEIEELEASLPELFNDLIGKWFIVKGLDTGHNNDQFLYCDVIKIKEITSIFKTEYKQLVLDLNVSRICQNFMEEDTDLTLQYNNLIPISEDFANGLKSFVATNLKIQESYQKHFAEIIKKEIEK